MRILSEIDIKNIGNNTPDVSIGITDEKDDVRKKFKRPLMLKIFIPLCIITLSTILICLLSLTNNNYVTTFEDNTHPPNILNNKIFEPIMTIRNKRQLEDCKECEADVDEDPDLRESVLRCKKNLENNKDCCELHRKIKKLHKAMDDVKKEFDLIQIPCHHQNDLESENIENKYEIEDITDEKLKDTTPVINFENESGEQNEEDGNVDVNIKVKVEEDNKATHSQQKSEYGQLYKTEDQEETTTNNYQPYTESILATSDEAKYDIKTNIISSTIANNFVEATQNDNLKYNNYNEEIIKYPYSDYRDVQNEEQNIINHDSTHQDYYFPDNNHNHNDNKEENGYDDTNNMEDNFVDNIPTSPIYDGKFKEESQSNEYTTHGNYKVDQNEDYDINIQIQTEDNYYTKNSGSSYEQEFPIENFNMPADKTQNSTDYNEQYLDDKIDSELQISRSTTTQLTDYLDKYNENIYDNTESSITKGDEYGKIDSTEDEDADQNYEVKAETTSFISLDTANKNQYNDQSEDEYQHSNNGDDNMYVNSGEQNEKIVDVNDKEEQENNDQVYGVDPHQDDNEDIYRTEDEYQHSNNNDDNMYGNNVKENEEMFKVNDKAEEENKDQVYDVDPHQNDKEDIYRTENEYQHSSNDDDIIHGNGGEENEKMVHVNDKKEHENKNQVYDVDRHQDDNEDIYRIEDEYQHSNNDDDNIYGNNGEENGKIVDVNNKKEQENDNHIEDIYRTEEENNKEQYDEYLDSFTDKTPTTIIESSTHNNYNEDQFEESYNSKYREEIYPEAVDFKEQQNQMNSNINMYPEKEIITQPEGLYEEEQTTDYPDQDNEDNYEEYGHQDEDIKKDLTTQATTSTTTESGYEVEETESNNYSNNQESQIKKNLYEDEEIVKLSTTTNQQELSTDKYTTMSSRFKGPDDSNQEEDYDINIQVMTEENIESTTQYMDTSSVFITPSYHYYTDEIKKGSYANENELKPEQIFKETSIGINYDDNSAKYDETIVDNDNSVDYYTDEEGNTEDIGVIPQEPQITSTTTDSDYEIKNNYQISEEKEAGLYDNEYIDSIATTTEVAYESYDDKFNPYQNYDKPNNNYYTESTLAQIEYEDQEQQEANECSAKTKCTSYISQSKEYDEKFEEFKEDTTTQISNEDDTNTNALEYVSQESTTNSYYPAKETFAVRHDSHDYNDFQINVLNYEAQEEINNNHDTKPDDASHQKTFNDFDQTESEREDYLKSKSPLGLDGDSQQIPSANTPTNQDEEQSLLKLNYPTAQPELNTNFYPGKFDSTTEAINKSDTSYHGQLRIQDNPNDIRIVNQNPIAQRFQNTGSGSLSKFDNIFQLPPIESSKASQQLTVNTNMMPLCFYGYPNQNGPVLRQPGYESQINPFSMTHTAYGAFGYPQMYPNSLGQQPMYNYYNSLMAQQKYSQSNFMNQPPYMNNPYFCTYVPSSSLQFPPVSGVQEFRNNENKNFPLPEDVDDKTIPDDWYPKLINTNKSRSSSHCLLDEKSCFDGAQCIKSSHWCDGIVHCSDKSDEIGCPCKTRVEKSRLCDGYFDCPNGEDELGCFGCSDAEFSCDDWSERQRTATCVPLHQRCDGTAQCKTGKDEMDCSLLTNSINVHQTYAVSKSSGYLHRNFKGSWYPVCSNTDTWVLDACLAEVGPHATFPLVHMLPVPTEYTGRFLTALPDKKAEFLKSCMGGEAVYIICPPIPCGTRLLPPPNHYRKHEVDTSAEEDFLPFVNRLRRFTDELHKVNHHPNVLSSNDFGDKRYHQSLDMHVNQKIDVHNDDWFWDDQERKKRGETRVVGGKPSQPTSWPWVVAIYRDGIFHCGGVLMSELWVITAAHCVDTYWQHYYEVQGGMLRRFSFSPMEQNRVVSNIIGHQMYDRADMKNDLALLKVGTPFQFNRWVRPVCLPSESSAGPNWMWGPQPGTICTAVGWGATIEHGPDPDHMREVEVPILSHCKHREDQEGQEICAGYLEGGRDACQGDSGGPLLCRNPLAPSQWYVAGIVSHGEGCARPNEPGAYTRVSLYLNWIARSILDENLPKRKPIQKCPGTLCLGTRRCISKKRRCDKTIDCLVGDDEINCPKTDFPSLIKHAFDNMLLFASNNMTTVEPEDTGPPMETNDAERKGVKINNGTIVTIAEEHSTENDSIARSTFKDDGGQATTMNRNGGISSTFTAPLGEISDITRPITNAPAAGETPSASITPSTFITTDDTISESTSSAELTTSVTPVNDVTVTTSIRSSTETPAPNIINDSRGALNTNDKNMVDTDHKTETATPEEIKSITETTTAHNAGADDFTETNNNSNMNASKSISQQMPTYFECRKMLQLIPISRRCNKVIDCEDGTDEARCSCKGYLFASHPEAICDGVIDCADASDEQNCMNCPETHFHCHLSQQCIPKSFQCNHVPDCFFSEDEWDCFALTNGSYIRYDSDERPELRSKGVMSFSFSGKWFPLCNNNWFHTAHDVAGDMCAYLGFSGYQKYFETEVKQENIEILSRDERSLSVSSSTTETCKGLFVKCSNSLSDTGDMKKIYTAHQSGANAFKEVLMSPWNAAIFVDGVYTCSGTLIDKNWVITSRPCLHHIHLHMNYTTVILGAGRTHFNVIGPHEQIRLVSEMIPVIVTDILLLKLKTPVTFTRNVRPLYIRNINNDIVSDRETCIVLGRENDSFMQAIVLKPALEKCMKGKRCFKRITPFGNCNAATSIWGGTIVCLSETGWYPAAVYYDSKGLCGFRTTTEYTSIRNLKTRIINTMNKRDFPIAPPTCNGIRCPLGQCVSLAHVCDGISDCRDGSDETQEICDRKTEQCSATGTCECAPNALRCHNGRCVLKSAFCDRVNDCGDWSDEPARCNCSAYLALVAPHRLCDGISNCHDKSDENPRICGCREENFKCGKSGVCIPNDWVCDGDYDCPEQEDELFCLALRAPKGERDGVGEVVVRAYGVWHSYCVRDKPLNTPDLEEICMDLGHNAAHAAAVNKTFLRPAQDIAVENFSLVRFNEYVMMFLKGDYPMAKLQNNDKCERLYIECTPP